MRYYLSLEVLWREGCTAQWGHNTITPLTLTAAFNLLCYLLIPRPVKILFLTIIMIILNLLMSFILHTCRVEDTVEDEIHFIFQCEPLRFVREKHQQPLHCDFLNDDSQVTPTQLLKHFMSANTIETFAKFLQELYDARRDTLYNS